MAFKLPKTTFDPHPEGTFEGIISEIRDEGEKETKWGPKHRIAIVIENQQSNQDNGLPRVHFEFCNLATGKNARLTELRQKLCPCPDL